MYCCMGQELLKLKQSDYCLCVCALKMLYLQHHFEAQVCNISCNLSFFVYRMPDKARDRRSIALNN